MKLGFDSGLYGKDERSPLPAPRSTFQRAADGWRKFWKERAARRIEAAIAKIEAKRVRGSIDSYVGGRIEHHHYGTVDHRHTHEHQEAERVGRDLQDNLREYMSSRPGHAPADPPAGDLYPAKFCGVCGATNTGASLTCHRCGQPLSVKAVPDPPYVESGPATASGLLAKHGPLCARCPECSQMVELQRSTCDCEDCKHTLYLQAHFRMSVARRSCDGSGHGARRGTWETFVPDTSLYASADSPIAYAVEKEPEPPASE